MSPISMNPILKTTVFLLSAATALSPLALAAEHFDARSSVESATLYPQGAQVTRSAVLTLPAGTHEVEFFDIPAAYQGAQPDGLQTSVSGAVLGPIAISTHMPNEAELLSSDEALALQAVIDALEDKIAAATQDIEAIAIEGVAAEDALRFIHGLSAPEEASAEDIIAFAQAIREQSLEARQITQSVAVRTLAARDAIAEDVVALNEARAALPKLITTTEYRNKITLQVSVEKAGEVEIDFTYFEPNAGWTPQYQARLDSVEESLTLERTMAAVQVTGEPWIDVSLSFATKQPSRRTAPSYVGEAVRRIMEPAPRLSARSVEMSDDAGIPMPIAGEMMAMEKASFDAAPLRAAPTSYGLSLTYDYASLATLYSSNASATEFALEPLTLTPQLYVRAVPLYDTTGYLVADLTNESGEVILPGAVKLFRDGALLGDAQMQTQADGSEFEMSFGAIEGIRVARVLLDRNEGDRGIISKSNENSLKARLEVENLTSRTWDIELLDRVSVSEQEDLRIEWEANPEPDEENVDDRRGVLAWRFDLKSGAQENVTLDESINWPEGQILR